MDIEKNEWVDCGSYWHYNVKQGGWKWDEIKKGRLGGTKNNGENDFGVIKDDIAMFVAGVKQQQFGLSNQQRMTYGIKQEPKSRQYYENKYNCKVQEMGFCIPKYNHNIGVSIDGMVVDEKGNGVGIIEIKCPYEMYHTLENHIKYKTKGWNHIFRSHYKQMQMGMAITGLKWCDYIVYSRDLKVYIERVPFNCEFWQKLYKEIVVFHLDYVSKYLKNSKYPIPVGSKI